MKKLNLQIVLMILAMSAAIIPTFAQSLETAKTRKKVKIIVPEIKIQTKKSEPLIAAQIDNSDENPNGEPVEKAIAVAPKINISLCVGNGNLRVRGWNRNEVRVYLEGGNKVNFRVMQSDEETKLPVWLMVVGFERKTKATTDVSECFYGETMEVEVPFGTTLDVKGTDGDWRIEDLTKVRAQNVAGNITVRNINRGIEASSQSGNVSAEDAAGQISLKSVAGAVRAVRVKPNEIGDSLRVGSNSGQVLLQDIKHLSVEAGSTAGEVLFFGGLTKNGNYEFSTTTGSISLFLPPASSFRMNALSSLSGSISTDFKLESVSDIKQGQTRRMNGICGSGDADIKMTSFNGALSIKKK